MCIFVKFRVNNLTQSQAHELFSCRGIALNAAFPLTPRARQIPSFHTSSYELCQFQLANTFQDLKSKEIEHCVSAHHHLFIFNIYLYLIFMTFPGSPTIQTTVAIDNSFDGAKTLLIKQKMKLSGSFSIISHHEPFQ